MSQAIGIALIGAGRIGLEHARNLANMPEVKLVAVADPNGDAAAQAALLSQAERTFRDPAEAIAYPGVDAVVIASPSVLHAEHIRLAAHFKRAIFCEKPIALTLAEAEAVATAVRDAGVPFQIGFQRRYDPGYIAARERLESIGPVEQFHAVTRDPFPPSPAFLKASGGLFIDLAIHDFDLARFLVGDVAAVQAWGRVFVDPEIAVAGDVDTTITVLEFANGALGVIENSRRAVYGYDIRTEIFGAQGMLVIHALPKTPLYWYSKSGVIVDHFHFFLDRFQSAYQAELAAFCHALRTGKPPTPNLDDALQALAIGLAAAQSVSEGRRVAVAEVLNHEDCI
ncbi:inositol 2-dehydrogenase [Thermorudis peleae]|uniref:inositol 2-dehydrogenase n=1 Tax=Thermorudis peleae TaxID=1382356 RepID=UPI0005719BB5|nr:inositol 2-dehydrogenase [Thermorudis peleae]